jgi:two-component system, OmpR family, heavy metal sensor histidine kinase CusS
MIKLSSFRLRIALLSTALAGSTLVGFASVAWFQIYTAQVGRLDAQLFNQLMRATRSPDLERLQFYGDSLSYAFGTNTKIPIALLVLDSQGERIFQANSLPDDLDVNGLLQKRLQLTPLPLFPRGEPRLKPERRDSSGFLPPLTRPLPPPLPPTEFVTEQTKTETWRIGAAKFPNFQIAIAVSLKAIDQDMIAIRNIFLVLIPAALLVVAFGAWLVAGGALRPIRQLTHAIQQVTVKGLDRRIPTGTTDVEFVELILVFNQMLERLERSFTQASRFSGDAAHELKTPLTILQGELERTLQQVEPGSQVQQSLSNLLDEVCRLSTIMRKLLLLSLADAGQMSLYRVSVDMSELLVEMLEDVELLAPHLQVKIDISPGLLIPGDRDLLIQVVQNILSNAIKYNLTDGWIKIQAAQTSTTVQVTIINASIDIPDSERSRIFDRFHRCDPARNRKIEGIGLGLSLAREIARAHGGDLTLGAISSGQTAFVLTLPIN